MWSGSPCFWNLWLEGGVRPGHFGDTAAAAFTSSGRLLGVGHLATPSTRDWSSLSLLWAEEGDSENQTVILTRNI